MCVVFACLVVEVHGLDNFSRLGGRRENDAPVGSSERIEPAAQPPSTSSAQPILFYFWGREELLHTAYQYCIRHSTPTIFPARRQVLGNMAIRKGQQPPTPGKVMRSIQACFVCV